MGSLFLTVYFSNFTWRFCTSAQADQMPPFLFLVSLSHILSSSAGCCLKLAVYPMHVKKAEKAYCSSVEARLSTVTPIRKCYKLPNSHKLCRFCWKWWKTNHLQRKWNCLLLTWILTERPLSLHSGIWCVVSTGWSQWRRCVSSWASWLAVSAWATPLTGNVCSHTPPSGFPAGLFFMASKHQEWTLSSRKDNTYSQKVS